MLAISNYQLRTFALFLLFALPARAQVTKPPDPLANLPLLSQAQANVQTDLLAYKGWVESQIAPGGTLDQHDAAIKVLQSHDVANTGLIASHQGQITTLQNTVNDPNQGNAALLAQIQALQAQVKALQTQPQSASGFALGYSLSSNRAAIQNLSGANIKGSVFIFSVTASNISVASPTGITSVCYLLNGKAIRNDCETQTPFDFIGGTVAAALPWDSTTVSNGLNTITQTVTRTTGTTEVDTVSFTVAN